MTGQVKSPGSAPAARRALQTHVGVIKDLDPRAVGETRSFKSRPANPSSLHDARPARRAGALRQKGVIAARGASLPEGALGLEREQHSEVA